MNSLREQIKEAHIKENYPCARIVQYDNTDGGLKFYTTKQLQKVKGDWFPLCCYLNKNNEVVYGGRDKIVHTYTEGETGAGKTTRFVMQSIRALSSLANKPSFVIVDIHGEIIENLYQHLKENGYAIKILNCDNPSRSDTYNPFTEMVKECMEKKEITYNVISNIRRISEIIQPIESQSDPIWDRGARSYTNGCILDKFEDLLNNEMPPECMTIYNVVQNHFWIRERIADSFGSSSSLFNIPHYKKKGTKALSTQKIIAVTNNAEKTRNSYFGVVENHYDVFGQPSLYALSSSNTIDIREFLEKPTAIVIQSGNTKIGDDLISLLMNDIYTTVVKVGKESETKMLPRKIHCFLDEFANCNIADGPKYIEMLTTSRKFGMYWHMFLQCDAQLDRKFDMNIGKIIRANSTEIFMGSNDYETMRRFAQSCGQKTIESLESYFRQEVPTLSTVDLLTAEELNLTEEGWMYIKSSRHSVMKSYFEAFYKCPEFKKIESLDEVYPYNTFNYRSTEFYPDDIPVEISAQEFELIKYIRGHAISRYELEDIFKCDVVRNNISRLIRNGMITEHVDGNLRMVLSERQYSLLEKRTCPIQLDNEKEAVDDMFMDDFDFDLFGGKKRAPLPPEFFDMNEEKDNEEDGNERSLSPMFNPLVMLLKSHIDRNYECIDLTHLDGITCIPDFLMEIFEHFYNKAEGMPDEDALSMFKENPNILKFEIIERFIANNEFEEKIEWDNNIKKEVLNIIKSKAFPFILVNAFENARSEIIESLTLTNIREIKKIIEENS